MEREKCNFGRALIFLHIPKAAGSTLHTVLSHQDHPGLVWTGDGHQLENRLRHADAATVADVCLLKGHMGFGLHRYLPQGADYLTVMRDPVDRVVSYYHHVRTRPDHVHHGRIADRGLNLEECVRLRVTRHGFDNGQTRCLAGWDTSELDMDRDGAAALAAARQHLEEHCAVAGLAERFDETLLLCAQRFGWCLPFYCSENVNRLRPRAPLAPELAALIRETHGWDCALYQHVSARFEAAVRAAPESFARDLARFRRLNAVYQGSRGYVRGAMRRVARWVNRTHHRGAHASAPLPA